VLREHRSVFGAFFLSVTLACWTVAPSLVAGSDVKWSGPVVRGLLVAGAFGLVLAIAVLSMSPVKSVKPESLPANHFSELILKYNGLWPAWWQRLLHPRTPKEELPVRVPETVLWANEAYRDGLKRMLDELNNSARVLGSEIQQDRHYGPILMSSAWDTQQHLLDREELVGVYSLVGEAHRLSRIRNANSEERLLSWDQKERIPRLSSEERQQRQETYQAVLTAAERLEDAVDQAGPPSPKSLPART
jgi:hypothetical protein